jgi:hypothetical protein
MAQAILYNINMEKTLCLIALVLVICVPSAYAETAYQSEYKHGVADANVNTTDSNVDLYYIHQPGQGFANHTAAFVKGYIEGWCSITGPGSGIDVNDDENPPTVASFDCDKGLISVYPYPNDFPTPPPGQHYTACEVDIKGEPTCTYANNTN